MPAGTRRRAEQARQQITPPAAARMRQEQPQLAQTSRAGRRVPPAATQTALPQPPTQQAHPVLFPLYHAVISAHMPDTRRPPTRRGLSGTRGSGMGFPPQKRHVLPQAASSLRPSLAHATQNARGDSIGKPKEPNAAHNRRGHRHRECDGGPQSDGPAGCPAAVAALLTGQRARTASFAASMPTACAGPGRPARKRAARPPHRPADPPTPTGAALGLHGAAVDLEARRGPPSTAQPSPLVCRRRHSTYCSCA